MPRRLALFSRQDGPAHAAIPSQCTFQATSAFKSSSDAWGVAWLVYLVDDTTDEPTIDVLLFAVVLKR